MQNNFLSYSIYTVWNEEQQYESKMSLKTLFLTPTQILDLIMAADLGRRRKDEPSLFFSLLTLLGLKVKLKWSK